MSKRLADRESGGGGVDMNSSVSSANLKPSIRVDSETADLLERLLQIARVSALEEMASGMAHELNQPLGAIATFAQAARRMLDRPTPMLAEAIEALEHISTEALNAGKGVHRIRELFNGRRVVTRTTCKYSDLVEELMPVLDVLAERRNVTLELTQASELPPVAVDPLRIQHVLFTLIQNALDAKTDTKASTIRIIVSGDQFGIKTVIEDEGAGIPMTTSENIFRPFFTTKSNGTGLGLASSRAIIERHEGKIGFENLATGGARFWFTLPAAPEANHG